MTIQPYDPHENEPDDFGLGRFHLDPKLVGILEHIELSQLTLPGTAQASTIRGELNRLNTSLESTGWVGTPVRYTGKLRVTPELVDADDGQVDKFIGSHYAHADEDLTGGFLNVSNLPLIMTFIDTDTDLDLAFDEIPRLALTFMLPETLEAIEPDVRYELVRSAGHLMAYPDDITVIDFDRPSAEQVEQDLKLSHPKIYQRIVEPGGVSADCPDGRSIWRSLKNFEIPVRDGITPAFMSRIGDVLYARMDPDSTSTYEFTLDGEIYGLGDRHPQKVEPAGTRLRGYLCKIDFMEVDNVYRPIMIVAEQSARFDDSEADWEMRVLPIDSVTKIRWEREHDRRFGETAMKKFTSPEDVAEYWRTLTSQTTDPASAAPDELDPLASLEGDDFFTGEYNETQQFYEHDISEDWAVILKIIDT